MKKLSPLDLLLFGEFRNILQPKSQHREPYWQAVSFIPALYSYPLTDDMFPPVPRQPVLEELLMREHAGHI